MSPLEVENQALREENFRLRTELAQLKKLIFAARRERFVPEAAAHPGSLFEGEATPAPDEPPVVEEAPAAH